MILEKVVSLKGQEFTLHLHDQHYRPSQDEVYLMGSGMATYRFFMGDDEEQRIFFSKIIRWERCLFVKHEGRTVAYLTFYAKKKGAL